jgi:hypothetical protein
MRISHAWVRPASPTRATERMALQVDDRIRIVRLLVAQRDVSGASTSPPQPRVGEEGDVVADVGEGILLVEHSTADGRTIWLAEFLEDELELVARPLALDED